MMLGPSIFQLNDLGFVRVLWPATAAGTCCSKGRSTWRNTPPPHAQPALCSLGRFQQEHWLRRQRMQPRRCRRWKTSDIGSESVRDQCGCEYRRGVARAAVGCSIWCGAMLGAMPAETLARWGPLEIYPAFKADVSGFLANKAADGIKANWDRRPKRQSDCIVPSSRLC
jgi:hypothetical protein